ncbi:unnamed protein product, partial [Staurois parvus]
PRSCIHYIWSSTDPAFTISGLPQYTEHTILLNPGPCIHYIWPPTVHTTWKCNYFSKYKLLNTFSHHQLERSCDFY